MGLVVPRALGRLQDELPAGRWTLAHLELERLQLLDLFIYLKRSQGELVKKTSLTGISTIKKVQGATLEKSIGS